MPTQPLHIEISADSSSSARAFDDVNSRVKSLGGNIGDVAQRSADMLTAVDKGLLGIANSLNSGVEQWRSYNNAISASTDAATKHISVIATLTSHLKELYQTIRTSAPVLAGGIAGGGILSAIGNAAYTYSQGGMLQQQDLMAAANAQTISARQIDMLRLAGGGSNLQGYMSLYNDALGNRAGIQSTLGVFDTASKDSIAYLRDVASALTAIQDPVQRARTSMQLFGDDSSQALALLNQRFAENVSAVKSWDLAYSDTERSAIEGFKNDVDSLKGSVASAFHAIEDGITLAMERARKNAVVEFTGLYADAKNWLGKIGALGHLGNNLGMGIDTAEQMLRSPWITSPSQWFSSSAFFKALDQQYAGQVQSNIQGSKYSDLRQIGGDLDSVIDPVLASLNKGDNSLDGLKTRLDQVRSARQQLLSQYFDVNAETGQYAWKDGGDSLSSAQQAVVATKVGALSSQEGALMAAVKASEQSAEEAKRAAEMAKQAALDLQRKRSEDLRHSQEALTGYSGPYASEWNQYMAHVKAATTQVDPQTGQLVPMTPAPGTLSNWAAVYQQQMNQATGLDLEAVTNQLQAAEQRNADDLIRIQREATDKSFDYRLQGLEREEQAELKGLESTSALTIQQKQAVAAQRLAIEVKYQNEVAQLEIDRLRQTAQYELALARQKVAQNEMSPEEYGQLVDAKNSALHGDIQEILAGTGYKNQGSYGTYQQTTTNLAVDQYKQTFDAIRGLTDQFLNDITSKSKSLWQSLTDDVKKTFENLIKQLLADMIAGDLTHALLGYGPTGAAGATVGGGRAAGLAGLFGLGRGGNDGSFAVPWSGGSGTYGSFPSAGAAAASIANTGVVSPSFGSGDIGNNSLSLTQSPDDFTGILRSIGVSGPGGTPGFLPGTVGGGGGWGSYGTSGGGYSGASGGLLGMLLGGGRSGGGGLGGLLASLGGGNGGGGLFGGIKAQLGIGGPNYGSAAEMASGLAGLEVPIGAGLMLSGWSNRGTLAGSLEDIGGGALIGLRYGGPIGAAIGAAAGGIEALIGWLVGNPLDKVKSQVKAAYGVRIDDQTAQAILKIAQQSYGGDIALAISSSQVRKMLALYSEATGQGSAAQGISPTMTPYTVAGAGSSAYNIPSTVDGSVAASYGGILPTLGVGQLPGGSGGLSAATPSAVILQLDGPSTVGLLNGVATTVAPTAVQNAPASTMSGNAAAARMFSPGLITR
jgi:hypothetical protein